MLLRNANAFLCTSAVHANEQGETEFANRYRSLFDRRVTSVVRSANSLTPQLPGLRSGVGVAIGV